MQSAQTSDSIVGDLGPVRPRAKRHRDHLTATTRISDADEARLTSYLGDLGTQFERSIFGLMLDRQEAAGEFSARCRRCQGAGIIDGPGGFGTFTEETKASRQAPTRSGIEGIPDESIRWEKRERLVPTGGWCRPCNGTGSVPRPAEQAPVCDHCEGRGRVREFNNRPGIHEAPCAECLGTGHLAVTVEPTGSSVDGGGVLPSEESLYLFAGVSRQLGAVRARSKLCARVLELMHGDQGARWARSAHGRLFALYQETPSGKRLAKRSEGRLVEVISKRKPGERWKNPVPGGVADPFSIGVLARYRSAPSLQEAMAIAGEDWASNTELRRQRDRRPRGFIGPIREWPIWLAVAPATAGDHDTRPAIDLTVQERIAVEATLERQHKDPHRAKLLRQAGEEALALYERAAKLWVRMGERHGKLTKRTVEGRAAVIRIHDRLVASGHESAADYIAAQVAAG